MREIRGHFLSFLQGALLLTGVPAHANTPPLVCEYGLIEVHSPNADFISSHLVHIGSRLDSLRQDENLILDAMDNALRADGHPDLVRAVQELTALDSRHQKTSDGPARADLLRQMAGKIESTPEFGVYQDSSRARALAKSISEHHLNLPRTSISSREAVHLALHLQNPAPTATAKTRINALVTLAQTREMLIRTAQDFRDLRNDPESGEIESSRDLRVQLERAHQDLHAARAARATPDEINVLELKSRRLERLSDFLQNGGGSAVPPL